MKDEIPFWVPFDGSNIPRNAVVGGKCQGQKVFIGRAHHEGKFKFYNFTICLLNINI